MSMMGKLALNKIQTLYISDFMSESHVLFFVLW